MKKIWLFLSLLTCGILLTGCFDKQDPEVIDDCIFPEDCAVSEPIEEDFSNKYLTAFWTEPFWDIEISWWIAKFSSPMYETDVVEVPVNIWKEWENYYFSWEELEGEFIKKDCLDNNLKICLFIKKSDGEGSDFYYMGNVKPIDWQQKTIKNDKGQDLPIVNFLFSLDREVREDIYEYLIS